MAFSNRARMLSSIANHRPTNYSYQPTTIRGFSLSTKYHAEGRKLQTNRTEPVDEHDHDEAVEQEKEKQIRTPWHREGSNKPPVSRPRSASAMTKGKFHEVLQIQAPKSFSTSVTRLTPELTTTGKLLTTPSRLLKLIIPLTTLDKNVDRKTIEPLALLVHPQQPLSYLERLIQSELPSIKSSTGEDKIPAVHFRAEDSQQQDAIEPSTQSESDESSEDVAEANESVEETHIDGKTEKTGVIRSKVQKKLRGGPGEGGVESYSGHGREGSQSSSTKFVRWSSSTEIGDFIRDAARGKEFAIEIEGASKEIRVGVPSFNDRTFYLRQRLRKTARAISDMAQVKRECDMLAHKAAQRVAIGGFCGMAGWWAGVYYLTFQTDLGWDTMEPVTYLVGLSGIMCGYLWFLYHNREVSYRSAMNLTVSRRQSKLYAIRGFDLGKWEELVKEGNALRSEIKGVAREYDVDWNEKDDEGDEEVTKALKKERKKNGAQDEKKKKKDDDDEDDD